MNHPVYRRRMSGLRQAANRIVDDGDFISLCKSFHDGVGQADFRVKRTDHQPAFTRGSDRGQKVRVFPRVHRAAIDDACAWKLPCNRLHRGTVDAHLHADGRKNDRDVERFRNPYQEAGVQFDLGGLGLGADVAEHLRLVIDEQQRHFVVVPHSLLSRLGLRSIWGARARRGA